MKTQQFGQYAVIFYDPEKIGIIKDDRQVTLRGRDAQNFTVDLNNAVLNGFTQHTVVSDTYMMLNDFVKDIAS